MGAFRIKTEMVTAILIASGAALIIAGSLMPWASYTEWGVKGGDVAYTETGIDYSAGIVTLIIGLLILAALLISNSGVYFESQRVFFILLILLSLAAIIIPSIMMTKVKTIRPVHESTLNNLEYGIYLVLAGGIVALAGAISGLFSGQEEHSEEDKEEVICPQCDVRLETDMEFCPYCGIELTTEEYEE